MLAHVAEIQTVTVLARRWNAKCYVTTMSELNLACHRCNMGLQEELSFYFLHPFYLFIHSFFLLQCVLINSVVVIIDLCTYFSM